MKRLFTFILLFVLALTAKAEVANKSWIWPTVLEMNYTFTTSQVGDTKTIVVHVFGYNNVSGGYLDVGVSAPGPTWTGGNTTNGNRFNMPVSDSVDMTVTFTATTYTADTVTITYSTFDSPNYFDMGFETVDQEVTLSPDDGAGSILEGDTFMGTASGALAGNPYNISIVSGPGTASINSSTGAYTVTATGGGLIHYKVWISAGGGYDRSPDKEANIAVALSKKVKITIPANNGKYPIHYKIWQGETMIGERIQQPGDGAIISTINTGTDGTPVHVTATTLGIASDDGVTYYVQEGGEVNATLPGTVVPEVGDGVVFIPEAPNTSSSTTSTPQSGAATIWRPGTQSKTDPNAQVDLLTNETYREGIDKLIKEVPTDTPDQGPAIITSTNDTAVKSTLDKAADVKEDLDDAREALASKSPNIISVTGSQLTYSLPFDQLGHNVVVDLSWATTGISLMRTLIKVLFLGMMWFVYVLTLRSAQV